MPPIVHYVGSRGWFPSQSQWMVRLLHAVMHLVIVMCLTAGENQLNCYNNKVLTGTRGGLTTLRRVIVQCHLLLSHMVWLLHDIIIIKGYYIY